LAPVPVSRNAHPAGIELLVPLEANVLKFWARGLSTFVIEIWLVSVGTQSEMNAISTAQEEYIFFKK
jgi:hypothetical protein